MDTLVAQYSRPAFHNEGYSQYEQQKLTQATPPLSLRFALPPIANVCIYRGIAMGPSYYVDVHGI